MQNSNPNQLPPGFIIVPSRSRPGEVAYWSRVLGQKFSSVELCWMAQKRLIETKPPNAPTVDASFEIILDRTNVSSPGILSPVGGRRSFPTVGPKMPARMAAPPIVPFTDKEFPPAPSTIGKTSSEDATSRLRIPPRDRDKCTWVRLPEYIRRVNGLSPSFPIELFGDIEPHDLIQGIVGDCWLLATMACLAEFPDAVESLFCGTTKASPDGKYTIKLFDLDSHKWERITIDDYIPCRVEKTPSNETFLRPLFAIPNGNQMWAALLEKAVAKFVGSYAKIAGGHEPFAMIAFTGFPQVYQFKRVPVDEGKTIAKVGEWERGWAQWAGRYSPSCGYRPALPQEGGSNMDNSELFARLLEYDRMNYLLAASIVCFPPPATANGFIRPDGLVLGHAYSMLSVEEFDTVKLVKLRNPHGFGTKENPTEWNGPWSDDSEEWRKNPTIANCVGHEKVHDGIFWMEFSAFVSIFDKVLVLPFPVSEPRGAISSMRRAKIRASMRTATNHTNAVAGVALEKLTHIDEVITAIHLMSVRPYDPYLNAPDWVRTSPELYTRWAHEKLGTSPHSSPDSKTPKQR